MGIEEQGIVVRQSRISYINNYAIFCLVAILFAMSWYRFGLTFSMRPQSFEESWKTYVVIGFALVMAVLLEEPIFRRWFRYYVITNNEIILREGILKKNMVIIPHHSISNVDVYKGMVGRILNFGDVIVVGFRNKVVMRGIREPEVFYRIINNKISITSGTKHTVVRDRVRPRKIKKGTSGWDDPDKTLREKLGKKRKKKEKGRKTEKKKRRLSLKGLRKRKKKETEPGTEPESGSEPEVRIIGAE